MPNYVIKGFNERGKEVKRKEINCADDELVNVLSNPDLQKCYTIEIYEMRLVRAYETDGTKLY